MSRRALPALLLAAGILAASGPWASAEHTSSLAQPWFSSLGLSPEWAAILHFVVRKCGHVLAYAAFGVLALRALRDPSRSMAWRTAGFAWLLAILLASADETLQSFSPARGGCVTDVLLDSAGAALGILVAVRFALRRASDAEPTRADTEAA
jgi:VanZ family protein